MFEDFNRPVFHRLFRQLPVLLLLLAAVACRNGPSGKQKKVRNFAYAIERADKIEQEKDWPEAHRYLDSVYAFSGLRPTWDDRFARYYWIGRGYCNIHGDHQKALLYTDSMLQILEDRPHPSEESIRTLELRGLVLFELRRYPEAYRCYYRGRQQAGEIGDFCNSASLSRHLGNILFRQERYREAIPYYRDALVKNASCDTTDFNLAYLRQNLLNNIALAFERQELTDSTIYYYRRALEMVDRQERQFPQMFRENEDARSVIHGNLGYVLFRHGKVREGESYLKESFRRNSRSTSYLTIDAQFTGIKLGELYLALGETAKARQYLDTVKELQGIRFSEEADLRRRKLAWAIQDTLGNTAGALQEYKEYIALKEAYDHKNQKLFGSDFQDAFENMAREYELSLLKESDRLKTVYLILAFTISVFAIVILYLIIRTYRQSQANVHLLTRRNTHLQNTLRALEQSQKDNARILSMVAHDLRNPIAAMVSISDLLSREIKDEEMKEMVEMLRTSGTNAMSFIEDILYSHRSERMNMDRLDLDDLLRDCAGLMQIRAAEKSQTIRVDSEKLEITADREKLWRVISNLLANAIKFSPPESFITLSSESTEGKVRIRVKDQGIGIPTDIQNKVFEAFTEAKRDGTSGEKSFGLGLSISRQIITAHGGKIWFETEPGKGTTFIVELPV